MTVSHRAGALGVAVFLVLAGQAPARAADAVADFYKGKHIDMVIGSPEGGGYDLYSRMLARHMPKHLPGSPTIVPRNMPGAGTLVAANWLYNVAPKDGTVLGSVNQTVASDQAKGAEGIQYDARKFSWIGAPLVSNRMLAVWRKTGVTTIEEATKKEVIIGAAGLTSISVIFPQVSNNLFGTKFKIIAGYPGANPILLAMERGEVDGIGASSSWTASRPDWVKENRIAVLFQVGQKRDSEWPDSPLITELAKNTEQRQILDIISGDITMGYPLLTTPDVPADRVAALRKAFDDTMKDPEFLAEAKKSKLDIDPASGQALQDNVARIVGVSPDIVAKVKDALKTKDVNEMKASDKPK
jgi:tripartite-type tricarboxylate transporter receptor subunit TctC